MKVTDRARTGNEESDSTSVDGSSSRARTPLDHHLRPRAAQSPRLGLLYGGLSQTFRLAMVDHRNRPSMPSCLKCRILGWTISFDHGFATRVESTNRPSRGTCSMIHAGVPRVVVAAGEKFYLTVSSHAPIASPPIHRSMPTHAESSCSTDTSLAATNLRVRCDATTR